MNDFSFRDAKKKLFIAGPCAAESSGQVWSTACALKECNKIGLFRCGVWKPRSIPDEFEGMGEEVMPTLEKIQNELNLDVCVEVATPKHFEISISHGIRCFWIGARTTVNPFLVQEIAEAARGSDTLFLIKNPVAPDLKLWEGAFERLKKSGINKLAAVYRGFTTYDSRPYRNNPLWNLAIDWKQSHNEIPFICDPSHIAGRRKLIFEISQKAMFLDFDGLMIEVHINPEKALSDVEQQITPYEFKVLTENLNIPSNTADKNKNLEKYRSKIDSLDDELLSILSKRMEVSREIAEIKSRNNLSLFQVERWKKVLQSAIDRGKALNLSSEFVTRLMNLIHNESIEEQERTIK